MDAYSVVAVSPRAISGARRSDSLRNLEHIRSLMPRMLYIASTTGARPRLVVVPEVAIQGFRAPGASDEELAVQIPGIETDFLGALAKEFDVFIAGQLFFVTDERFPSRYFNYAFMIGPDGHVVYKRAKLQVEPVEISSRKTVVPHDVWDEWSADEDRMDSLYPVADTEIGRIGMMVCMEGGYPEIARGLALNGAEVIIRLTYREPYVSNGFWELQNRAHAHFNNAYVVAPNLGPQYSFDGAPAMDLCGGDSMIVDYTGNIVVRRPFAAADTMITHVIDIDQLRRERARNGFGNWMKDLRTEQFRTIYDRTIYPPNRYLESPPGDRQADEELQVLQASLDSLNRPRASTTGQGDLL